MIRSSPRFFEIFFQNRQVFSTHIGKCFEELLIKKEDGSPLILELFYRVVMPGGLQSIVPRSLGGLTVALDEEKIVSPSFDGFFRSSLHSTQTLFWANHCYRTGFVTYKMHKDQVYRFFSTWVGANYDCSKKDLHYVSVAAIFVRSEQDEMSSINTDEEAKSNRIDEETKDLRPIRFSHNILPLVGQFIDRASNFSQTEASGFTQQGYKNTARRLLEQHELTPHDRGRVLEKTFRKHGYYDLYHSGLDIPDYQLKNLSMLALNRNQIPLAIELYKQIKGLRGGCYGPSSAEDLLERGEHSLEQFDYPLCFFIEIAKKTEDCEFIKENVHVLNEKESFILARKSVKNEALILQLASNISTDGYFDFIFALYHVLRSQHHKETNDDFPLIEKLCKSNKISGNDIVAYCDRTILEPIPGQIIRCLASHPNISLKNFEDMLRTALDTGPTNFYSSWEVWLKVCYKNEAVEDPVYILNKALRKCEISFVVKNAVHLKNDDYFILIHNMDQENFLRFATTLIYQIKDNPKAILSWSISPDLHADFIKRLMMCCEFSAINYYERIPEILTIDQKQSIAEMARLKGKCRLADRISPKKSWYTVMITSILNFFSMLFKIFRR